MANPNDREEAAMVAEAYESSGLTRREFCEERGLTVSQLEGLRRRARAGAGTQLVRVEIEGPAWTQAAAALVLALSNGRRIEVGAGFDGATLARLLALAEGR